MQAADKSFLKQKANFIYVTHIIKPGLKSRHQCNGYSSIKLAGMRVEGAGGLYTCRLAASNACNFSF